MGLVAFRFMVLSIMLRVMERIALSSDAMKPWFSSDSDATNQWFAFASVCNYWLIALNSDGIATRFAWVSETTRKRSSSFVYSLLVFDLCRVGSWISS